MTSARRRASLVIAAIALITAIAALAWTRVGAADEARFGERRDKPVLLLLTSLPIAFGENFSLEEAGSPLLEALEKRYSVRPIATSSAAELARGRLLLMAHPLAQPAEDLVALDDWVRDGGRVLLLADPLLEWPDSRSLGDPTRPPPMFMDTGLLQRWGLTLSVPRARGESERALADQPIVAVSPGELGGTCALAEQRTVATCTVGRGKVIVVADADFIDWRRGESGARGARAVIAALGQLERP